jgi:hypothetical protein
VRALLALFVVAGALACAGEVNCEKLCLHTFACEVTFAPSDDIEGEKITSGERTEEQACALGCQEHPAVTVESARCVDEITAASTDPAACQEPVLACFGAQIVDVG